ncbi:MAG TPA: hypothetical protein VFL66_08425 [Gaiellaceae bacterium]|nr:hypothetical protein [Gaiellaceae bacterium]
MRRLALIAVLAFAAAPAAAADGPSPGVLQGGAGVSAGELSYNTVYGGGRTSLHVWRGSEIVRTLRLQGDWGIPLVTYQQAGGLSRDGRTLVLAQGDFPRTPLRAVSRFLVLDAKRLAVTHRIALRGDFSFDALSPKGGTLFLVQHTSSVQLTHYKVRAYDLRASRLLRRVVADRRQASWVMNGMPMVRATGPGARWQYTLYTQPDNYPFVHALDTVTRTAVCIGIPWKWTQDMSPTDMSVRNGKLVIHIGIGPKTYVLDTKTLRLDG